MRFAVSLLLILACLGRAQQPASPKSVAPQVPATWKAGAASVIVTPEKNLFMAGYAARKKPAEGKVQDLFAKAFALEDEQGGRTPSKSESLRRFMNYTAA